MATPGAHLRAWGRAGRKRDVVSAPTFVSAPLGKCGHTSPFWRMVTNLVVGGRRPEPVNGYVGYL